MQVLPVTSSHSQLYYSPFEKNPQISEWGGVAVGGGGVHLIPDSKFLVLNTVRMYQRCSEA